MIEPPRILQTESQTAAVIRLTIPRAEIVNVMGPGIVELMNTLAAQKIAPAGPWYSHHHRMVPDIFDFEIGVPVNAEVAPAGRVIPGSLPAGRVARTVYHGPYEGLGQAWGEFDAWLASEGLTPAANLWEFYTIGPESGPEPSTYRTELNRPLAG